MRFDKTFILSLFIILTILRPSPINIFGEMASKVIIESLWFLFTFLFYITFNPKLKFRNFLFIFFLAGFLSLLVNPSYLFTKLSISDAYEILLIFNYLLIFNLGSNISMSKTEFERVVLFPFNMALSLTLFITYLSLLSDGFYDFIQSLYFFKSSARYSVERIRVSGTYTNPNHFSIFLNFAVIFLLYHLKTYMIIGRYRLLLILQLFLTILLILFTGSRTGLALLIFNFFAFLFFTFRLRLISLLSVIFFITSIIIFNLKSLVQLTPQRFQTTFLIIESGGLLAVESLRTKFELSKKLTSEIILESPLLGFGPSNNFNGSLGDSQIISTFYKYGLVGLIVFLCFFISNFFHLRKGRYFKFLPVILSISFLTGEFFYNPQITLIYLLLLGIVIKNRSKFSY